MKTRALILFLFTGAAISGCLQGPNAGAAAKPSDAWPAAQPGAVWDDGLAEVAVYDATRTIYGKRRNFEATILTAKEPFAIDRNVKADPPYSGRRIVDVLKQNISMTVPTQNYEYRFLGSTFIDRREPFLLRKASAGSQEWCGNTFHEFTRGPDRPRYVWHSYFDGEGDGGEDLSVEARDLFDDQLRLTLRFLETDSFERGIRLWPSFLSNRAGPLRSVEAHLRVRGLEKKRVAGREWDCRIVEITGKNFVQTYWIARDEARTLVAFESNDGRSLRLKSIVRRDYWSRTK